MALLSMMGNSSSSSVGSSVTSSISGETMIIILLMIILILLIIGLVYLIIKSGDLIEAKRKYYFEAYFRLKIEANHPLFLNLRKK